MPDEELNARLLGEDMTDQNEIFTGDFECVEPEIGARMWQRVDPGLSEELKEELADHLLVCSSCRLDALVEARITTGLRNGELQLGKPGGATVRRRDTFWSQTRSMIAVGSGLALAASMVLVLSLPPVKGLPPELLRGSDVRGGFLRPMEGEVVAAARPELRWAPIPGATAYRIEISQVDGAWSWSGRSDQAALTLPAAVALPADGEFRALVEPIPADLAGLVDVSVYFRRSGLIDFLGYRVGAARNSVLGLGWLGLFGLGWVAISRLRFRQRN